MLILAFILLVIVLVIIGYTYYYNDEKDLTGNEHDMTESMEEGITVYSSTFNYTTKTAFTVYGEIPFDIPYWSVSVYNSKGQLMGNTVSNVYNNSEGNGICIIICKNENLYHMLAKKIKRDWSRDNNSQQIYVRPIFACIPTNDVYNCDEVIECKCKSKCNCGEMITVKVRVIHNGEKLKPRKDSGITDGDLKEERKSKNYKPENFKQSKNNNDFNFSYHSWYSSNIKEKLKCYTPYPRDKNNYEQTSLSLDKWNSSSRGVVEKNDYIIVREVNVQDVVEETDVTTFTTEDYKLGSEEHVAVVCVDHAKTLKATCSTISYPQIKSNGDRYQGADKIIITGNYREGKRNLKNGIEVKFNVFRSYSVTERIYSEFAKPFGPHPETVLPMRVFVVRKK